MKVIFQLNVHSVSLKFYCNHVISNFFLFWIFQLLYRNVKQDKLCFIKKGPSKLELICEL